MQRPSESEQTRGTRQQSELQSSLCWGWSQTRRQRDQVYQTHAIRWLFAIPVRNRNQIKRESLNSWTKDTQLYDRVIHSTCKNVEHLIIERDFISRTMNLRQLLLPFLSQRSVLEYFIIVWSLCLLDQPFSNISLPVSLSNIYTHQKQALSEYKYIEQ